MNLTALYGLIAVAVLAVNGAEGTDQCQSGKSNLDVRMKSNKTGHWTTIQLNQPTVVDSSSQHEMHLQATPSVSVCEGVRTNSLLVTLQVLDDHVQTKGPPPQVSGYTYYAGVGSYKLHTERRSWAEAKAACAQEGTHLLIINSEKEAAVIRELMKPYKGLSDWLFIGFNDLEKEGTYVTVFGQPLANTGYTNWNTGQPDNAGGIEDCGTIYQNAKLNDLPCHFKVEFICEQKSS